MNVQRIIGVFNDEDKLLNSIDSLQEKGFDIDDVITPFAIEKVFEKLKLKTRINKLAFIYGVIGFFAISAFLYWTNVIDYPLMTGGKPQFNISFVVVIFIVTILFVIFFTLITFFVTKNKGIATKSKFNYQGASDDKFLILINKTKKLTDDDVKKINEIMVQNGAINIDKR